MKRDTFSQYHPLVNFLFFLLAIGMGVIVQHPAYLLAGVLTSALYYLLLKGAKGLKTVLLLIPTFLVLSLINPLFNTRGDHILFFLFGRPYTAQALVYGAAVASIFVITILWFGCYNTVLTSDKFCVLFGTVMPSLSLLLVMILRMIPNLIRRAKQISLCRSAIGKGGNGGRKETLKNSASVLSSLTLWSLEGSIITADSMRSRGYGAARRTSFHTYRFQGRDGILLCLMLLLTGGYMAAIISGGAEAVFTPSFVFAPLCGYHAIGFGFYCVFLLLPSVLHVKEALLWRFFISKI